MKDLTGDSSSGNLRLKASTGGGEFVSSPSGGSSLATSATNNPPTQRRCTIDGGVLLETEHVLLKVDPPLLACTARIRKKGRIYQTEEPLRPAFHQYELSVPIEVVRLILAALENALLAQGAEHIALQKLVYTWREIHERCSGNCQG